MWILENKLKLYEQNLKYFENKVNLRYKLRHEEIYKIKANGVKIRSKVLLNQIRKLRKEEK